MRFISITLVLLFTSCVANANEEATQSGASCVTGVSYLAGSMTALTLGGYYAHPVFGLALTISTYFIVDASIDECIEEISK